MRTPPLEPNHCYRVRRSFGISAPRAHFAAGQQVRYLRPLGHSRYDAASVFLFEELGTGARLELWWFDDEPEQIIEDYFERLPMAR